MRIKDFDWNDDNIEHIAEHNVEPDEAEEIFAQKPHVYRTRYGRYVAIGQALDGRFLFVVFEYKGKGTIRVISARDATNKERRLYGRKGRGK